MARGVSSNNPEGNGAMLVIESALGAAADKIPNNPDRKKQIKILALNLGIAAADIITLRLELIGSGGLATAFGVTIFFLSAVGVIYGNYRLFAKPERSIPTPEDYIDALNEHRELKTFEETIELAIDQIERLQKKNKNILVILPQIFGDSDITCNKFSAAIIEVKNSFFANIRNILNKLDTFDEEDYNFIRKKHEEGTVSQQIMKDKFEVYNEYVTTIKAATEDNEQILLMLDKLLLRISDIKIPDRSQRDQMAEMIDDLINQLKYYRN
ncbi:MAG: hypothetical protein PHY05_09050 [Methanothrix sp.]|nr:hypothetical protein [Methanothrix sp.]